MPTSPVKTEEALELCTLEDGCDEDDTALLDDIATLEDGALELSEDWLEPEDGAELTESALEDELSGLSALDDDVDGTDTADELLPGLLLTWSQSTFGPPLLVAEVARITLVPASS